MNSQPSASQQQANIIADTIKTYRRALRDLLKGKYACHADFLPRYLQDPCNICIIRCRDGVFVRYDSAHEGEPRLRVASPDESLAELAPKLSDYLIHWGTDLANSGVSENSPSITIFRMGPTGVKQDAATYRLGIFGPAQIPDCYVVRKPPAKPICLLSITNELVIEIEGEVVPTDSPQLRDGADVQQFLAHSRIQLLVGWLAIEIYPLPGDEYWKPEFAAIWAEMDILTIVAQRNLRESQLHSLDPRAETRRQYGAILSQFESLLQGPEEPIHQFLLQHPELLCPTYERMWSKVPFGARTSDFVFREPYNDYELVEIESPSRRLFRDDGQQYADLTHAINQISDWVRYIEDNKPTVERELELSGISTNPRRLVVIGRSNLLTDNNRRKLTTLQNEQPKLRILTYDDLLASARANLERILGPLSLTGENVKLYFFK